MSSEALPISSAKFAEALTSLPSLSLLLKLAELRHSIAQLNYSNEELRPYAEGRKRAMGMGDADSSGSSSDRPEEGQVRQEPRFEPDEECAQAINENDVVIMRMEERIDLIRTEVEGRGMAWEQFQKMQSPDPVLTPPDMAPAISTDAPSASPAGGESTGSTGISGEAQQRERQHPAWRDGTFQTGTLSELMTEEELVSHLMSRMDTDERRGNGHVDHNPGPDGGIDL